MELSSEESVQRSRLCYKPVIKQSQEKEAKVMPKNISTKVHFSTAERDGDWSKMKHENEDE